MLIYLQLIESETDKRAFERLYEESHGLMLRVAMRVLHNEQDAEDAVHQTFLNIIDKFEAISRLPRPEMTAFCVTMVKNASIDMLRRSRRTVDVEDMEAVCADAEDNVENVYMHNADVQRMSALLDELPPEEKQLIQMRYAMELGYAEIGGLLDISEDAARKRCRRLVGKLKERYGEDE